MIREEQDLLRHWWVAPAFAILLMLGAWAIVERPRIDVTNASLDTRFVFAPRAALHPVEGANDDDAWLRLDWRTEHDAKIRWSELDVRKDGVLLRYVGHDPGAGEWSAWRDDLYLSATERAREGDLVVVGEAEGSTARVQLIVDPIDRAAASVRLS